MANLRTGEAWGASWVGLGWPDGNKRPPCPRVAPCASLPSGLRGGGYREELEKDLGIRICRLRHQVARIEPRWRSPSLVVRPYVEPVA